MSKRQVLILLLLWALLAACSPGSPDETPLGPAPFPTMTPGRTIFGALSPVPEVQEGALPLSNPATIVAMANLASPTPDTGSCPLPGRPTAGRLPDDETAIPGEILRFLSEGGSVQALETALRRTWGLLDEDGYLRDTTDLTGGGTPELVLGYSTPGSVGTLLVLGCLDGRYVQHLRVTSDEAAPPQVLWLGDINHSLQPDLLYASRRCDEAGSNCLYEIQAVTWQPAQGRFTNLIEGSILSDSLPILNDIDNDDVIELVIQLESAGTSQTGPLRTGVHIYDWDGSVYVLSIVQLDPPRYRIQVVHEADRSFLRQNMAGAAELYRLALEDDSLRYWFNDGPTQLKSYILYRMLLAYAFLSDPQLLIVFQQLTEDFPITEEAPLDTLPIFAQMAYIFWNGIQVTNNLQLACSEVNDLIATDLRPLNLLNRYGSRSPSYSFEDLCPF